MVGQLPGKQAEAGSASERWEGLYRVGGICAFILGALFLVEMVIYIASAAPSLTDAAGWFNLLHNNRFLGLLDFGILELYGLLLFVPVFLAAYMVLRRVNESWAAIGGILALTGIAANFATNKLFSLLTLSDLYAQAATEVQKAQFLAAGQATLAVSALGGISGSVEGGIPMAFAGLILSVLMLRSGLLGRAAAYLGLVANALGLLMYVSAAAGPAMAGSPFFGLFFLSSLIWFVLLGRGLLLAGRRA